jgi:hypothetical protein
MSNMTNMTKIMNLPLFLCQKKNAEYVTSLPAYYLGVGRVQDITKSRAIHNMSDMQNIAHYTRMCLRLHICPARKKTSDNKIRNNAMMINFAQYSVYIYCTQPPRAEVTKMLFPHHKGTSSPASHQGGGPDL